MKKILLGLGVLLLGFNIHGSTTDLDGEWVSGFDMDGPSLALGIYSVTVLVLLYRVIDNLPGVFAARRPLGKIESAYSYLWAPWILSQIIGYSHHSWPDPQDGEGARTVEIAYGSANEGPIVLAAAGAFVLLMLVLKFHTAMVEANRRMTEQGAAV